MLRAECIQALAARVRDPFVVTTPGGSTHEWWNYGDNRGQLQARTLGLCSSIGLGLALALPHRQVIVLDGDGGLLMNLHSLVTSAHQSPPNLLHICFDNGVYESSGGTPTFASAGVDLASLARAAGVACVHQVEDLDSFSRAVDQALAGSGHTFIHARVTPGTAKVTPIGIDEVENKYRLARYVEQTEGVRILAGPTSGSLSRQNAQT